jgi:glycerophosphoryl diester phosphodiesterase
MQLLELAAQLRIHWRPILAVHLFFTLCGAIVLAPLFGLLVQGILSLSGTAAVADQDIAYLLLSPFGLVSGTALVAILLAITALELGALQVIAHGAQQSLAITSAAAIKYALRHAVPLLRLTLELTLRVLCYLLPYLIAVGAVAWFLLTDYDINYYLSQRPPEFYYALVIAGLFSLILVYMLGRRLLGWSMVLPLFLFSDTPSGEIFAESESITDGNKRTCLRLLLVWLVLAFLLALVPVVFLNITTGWLIRGDSPELSTLLLLLGAISCAWFLLSLLVAALNLGGFTLVIAALFERLAPSRSQQHTEDSLHLISSSSAQRRTVWGVAAVLFAAAALALVAGGHFLQRIQTKDDVLVVAHRGAAGSAPENTLAAIRQALADGADWVEIDVQETRDGQVVVIHDSDFMKLAGNPLKVWDGDLAQLRQIDIGSWFDTRFSDERTPTLQEVLQTIGGRAGLVIELKYYGHDEQLEQRVVDIVEAAGRADDVTVMSLQLEGIDKLRALRPDWTTGLLAAKAIGDLTRLDVDFLAVNQNMASPGFIRRAHRAGKKVFVWTVNDGLSVSRMASMGVDGVITDEPALARDILAQRAQLSSGERLLLSAAMFFGKPEVAKQYRDNSP